MNLSDSVWRSQESAIYHLRALYQNYGYSLYKVNKFEEYDLYAHNKSFLVSQNILTFTDTNGKLLALKPDVTLSIVKNVPDEDTVMHKFCYNENVYRTAEDSDGFREIMQTGLECIGPIDLYAQTEVILLAMKSLSTIAEDSILDISHMGLIEGCLEMACVSEKDKHEFLECVEHKNIHALKELCGRLSVETEMQNRLCALTELYAPIRQALPILASLVIGDKMQAAYDSLVAVCDLLAMTQERTRLYLDCSIVNDVHYYDGIIFKGFINGIPNSVLSGGRYDRLLQRLGKRSGAIGFAVYLDRLERLETAQKCFDVDTVLLYEPSCDPHALIGAQQALMQEGKTVMTTTVKDGSLSYRQLIKMTDGGLQVLETHD